MPLAARNRLSQPDLARHLGCSIGKVRRLIKRGVLTAPDYSDCAWDMELRDELTSRVRAYEARERARRAALAIVNSRKVKAAHDKAMVGRIRPVDLAALVKRDHAAVCRWIRAGNILDAPDDDGCWPESSKGRLIAQVRAFRRADLERRKSMFKRRKAEPELAPRRSESSRAREQLEALTQVLNGDDKLAMRVLERLAGMAIASSAAVEKLREARMIVHSLKRDPSTARVRQLSGHLGRTPREIAKAYHHATGTGLREFRAERDGD